MYIIVYTYMAPYIVNMQKLKLWENTYIRTYVRTYRRTDRQTARQPGSQADRQTDIDRCIGEQHLNNRIPCWQGPCFSTPVPEVHFHWNAKNLVQRVKDFFHAEPCQQELGEAMEFWRRCRVVHRLPYTSFSKVLKTGSWWQRKRPQEQNVVDKESKCSNFDV